MSAPVTALYAARPPPLLATHTAPPATMGGPYVVAPACQSGAAHAASHWLKDGVAVFTLSATSPRPSHSTYTNGAAYANEPKVAPKWLPKQTSAWEYAAGLGVGKRWASIPPKLFALSRIPPPNLPAWNSRLELMSIGPADPRSSSLLHQFGCQSCGTKD